MESDIAFLINQNTLAQGYEFPLVLSITLQSNDAIINITGTYLAYIINSTHIDTNLIKKTEITNPKYLEAYEKTCKEKDNSQA